MKKILFITTFLLSVVFSFAQTCGAIGQVNYSAYGAAGCEGQLLMNQSGVISTVTGVSYNSTAGTLTVDSININPSLSSLTLDTTVTDTLKPEVGYYYAVTFSQTTSVHDFVIELPYKPADGTEVVLKPAGNYTGVQIIKVLYLTGTTRATSTIASLYTVTFATNGWNPLTVYRWKYSAATGTWS